MNFYSLYLSHQVRSVDITRHSNPFVKETAAITERKSKMIVLSDLLPLPKILISETFLRFNLQISHF